MTMPRSILTCVARRALVPALLAGVVALGAVPPTAAKDDDRSWAKARADFLRAFDSNKPEERKNAIYDHLEGQDHAQLVRLLVRGVLGSDDEPAMVVAAAVEILGDVRTDEAVAELVKASRRGPVSLRSRVFEALGYCGAEAALVRLREALVDREVELRVMAAEALGRAEDARSVAYLAEALAAPEWPVRAAVIAALTDSGSDEAIPHLILQLGRESGRLREDARRGLQRLGKVRGGHSFDDWLRWYEKRGGVLDYDRGEIVDPPAKPTVVYHGLPTWARRVVFVFDVSKSMNEEIQVDFAKVIPDEVRKEGGPELARWKALRTKLEWAREHLILAIRTMDPDVEFGMITYNHGVTPVFGGKFVRATDDNKAKAIARVESLSPSGDTDLHRALSTAVRIPHGKDPLGKNLVDGAEVVYFLTDGSSTSGAIQDGHRIFEEFERLNFRRRIRFHCIGLGMHDAELLGNLATMGGITGRGGYRTM